ncbi:MAG TPA: 5'/3'-nucleotidase SurE [Anaerolineales bacterium]|nr:5'/3'-nucleotidase SurE [Anaerolineales bacterium]
MATLDRAQILLTNDDGIRSPGLWAAAEALSKLGFVTVAAPREQRSGSGRSMPQESDGIIRREEVTVGGKTWEVYAVGGSPAQAVQHGILEIMPRRPDLVAAGINYGENVGTSVTISGTVGAALEGAAFGVPSMAVSVQVESSHYLSYSKEVDFDAAAHFTEFFARKLLSGAKLDDVDVLKIDVPMTATPETPWRVTRLSRSNYFVPVKPERDNLELPARLGFRQSVELEKLERDSDVYALWAEGVVAVTPLSLDLTARVDLGELERRMRVGTQSQG